MGCYALTFFGVLRMLDIAWPPPSPLPPWQFYAGLAIAGFFGGYLLGKPSSNKGN